jgi:catechol 2,3-dioxygenase-like lactoylglutathione lyase family enzyme
MSERAFPIIYVDDVPAARAFYEALGFSQTYRFPAEGKPDYVTMSRALQHRHRHCRRGRRRSLRLLGLRR